MLKRTLTGVVLIAVLVCIISFAPVWALPIALGLMSAIAAHEFITAAMSAASEKHRGLLVIGMVWAAAVPFWVFWGEPSGGAVLGMLALVMLLFALAMTSAKQVSLTVLAAVLFAALVIPYLLSTAIRLVGQGGGDAHKGRLLVYLPIIGAFASDTFAYLTGRAFGRHKLCPEISPKKTVEGSVGGIVMAPLLVILYLFLISKAYGYAVSYPSAVVCGIGSAFAGQLGDLSMSFVKRRCGIKDFGKLLPGHGGILDRFDSILFAAPLCEVIMLLLPAIL